MCQSIAVLLLLAVILFGLMVFFHFKSYGPYDPEKGSDMWDDLKVKILFFFIGVIFLFVALTEIEEERRFLLQKPIKNEMRIEAEDRNIEEAMALLGRGIREMTRRELEPNGMALLGLRGMTRRVLEPNIMGLQEWGADEMDLREQRLKEMDLRECRCNGMAMRERKCEDAELPVRRRG